MLLLLLLLLLLLMIMMMMMILVPQNGPFVLRNAGSNRNGSNTTVY